MSREIYAIICEDQEVADQIQEHLKTGKVTYATAFDESLREKVVEAIDKATGN